MTRRSACASRCASGPVGHRPVHDGVGTSLGLRSSRRFTEIVGATRLSNRAPTTVISKTSRLRSQVRDSPTTPPRSSRSRSNIRETVSVRSTHDSHRSACFSPPRSRLGAQWLLPATRSALEVRQRMSRRKCFAWVPVAAACPGNFEIVPVPAPRGSFAGRGRRCCLALVTRFRCQRDFKSDDLDTTVEEGGARRAAEVLQDYVSACVLGDCAFRIPRATSSASSQAEPSAGPVSSPASRVPWPCSTRESAARRGGACERGHIHRPSPGSVEPGTRNETLEP